MDGMNVFDALKTKGPSPRREIFYSPVVNTLSNSGKGPLNPEDCAEWGQSCGGALRVDNYKIIVGYPGDARALPLPAWDGADPSESALDALHSAHAGALSQTYGSILTVILHMNDVPCCWNRRSLVSGWRASSRHVVTAARRWWRRTRCTFFQLTVSGSHSFSQSNSLPYVWMIRAGRLQLHNRFWLPVPPLEWGALPL